MAIIYRKEPAGTHPPLNSPTYKSTGLRHPKQAPLVVPPSATELSAPKFDNSIYYPHHDDLTKQCDGEPLGERMIVSGRVLDDNGDPLAGTLIELWQCNSAGRYHHEVDDHDAPLDPNFKGGGRVLTNEKGEYRFQTIKPGAYPWRNHPNAWRPAHLHFSIFGTSMLQRLITQMYFPGDPLLGYDPIFNTIPSEKVRERLISKFDWDTTQPEYALGYRFDIVLHGSEATPAN